MRAYDRARKNAANKARREAFARGDLQVTHGTLDAYRAGCRCDGCRAANAEYQRGYYRRRNDEKTRPTP